MQDRVLFGAEHAARIGLVGLTGYGHYHERYVRQNGEWKIAASRLTRLHLDLQPAAGKSWSSRIGNAMRSEEHTSELQSLMRSSSAVFCLKKKNNQHSKTATHKTPSDNTQ